MEAIYTLARVNRRNQLKIHKINLSHGRDFYIGPISFEDQAWFLGKGDSDYETNRDDAMISQGYDYYSRKGLFERMANAFTYGVRLDREKRITLSDDIRRSTGLAENSLVSQQRVENGVVLWLNSSPERLIKVQIAPYALILKVIY